MDHPAWPLLHPAAQRSQSNFRVCPCSPSQSYLPSPSSPDSFPFYRFCRFQAIVHIPYVWAPVPTACFSVTALFFFCLCKLRCLLLDVLSLLPQRRLHARCLLVTSLLPLWCFHSCCPCKAVSSMAVPTSHSFLSPEPLSRCLAQRGAQESRTRSVSCPCQIRAGYRRYREKTHPNNKGLKI